MTVSPVVKEIKRFSLFILRYLGFWLLFFFLCRVAFLGYHAEKLAGFPLATVGGIFFYGAYIDLSTACYLTVLPFLLWSANTYLPIRGSRTLVNCYTIFFIVLASVISVTDLHIYREWGTKLNAEALSYLAHPKEAFASVSSSPLFLLVFLAVVLSAAGFLTFRRICRGLVFSSAEGGNGWSRIPVFLLFAGLIFLGIRGSVGVACMNPSFAYFSTRQFANHAALNASWNLVYDLKYYLHQKGNSFVYMDDKEAEFRVARLTARSAPNDTEPVLTTKRPNIVIFILESWTADVIASLGAERGITPFFEELVAGGLLFTDFYANGYRSSYGIPAVLAGFPSTPEGSILNSPLKMDRLPTLGMTLKKAGYSSSFHYGGDDRFDDMAAFFAHSGFDRIVDRESFSKKDMDSKWGAHDGVLFNRVLQDLKGEKQPFFSALFTLSSHEPFEVPMAPVYPGKDDASLFKNAVHYSDLSLREFFATAKKEPWYQNTLFVFVADHGHSLPLHRPNNYMPQRYRIPLLLYGEVLKKEYRGVKKSTLGSQSDLVATLLAQMGLPHDEFLWSNNLFNRNRTNFAFYNFHEGFALKTEEQTTVFNQLSQQVILKARSDRSPLQDLESLKDAQAYLQYLSRRYSKL